MSRVKTVLVPIAAALLSCFVCFSGGWQTGHDAGYDAGYDAGKETRSAYSYTADDMTGQYNIGYSAGYSAGKKATYDTAYAEGKNYGYDLGYTTGYSKGKEDAAPKTATTSKPSATSNPSSQNNSQSVTVYVTNTGSKYHRKGCQYLRQSCIAISLSAAKNQGYTACSKCF